MKYGNIIYQRKFSHPFIETDAPAQTETSETMEAFSNQASSDRYQKILKEKVNVLMPERVQEQGFFIDAARCIAEYYEIDTVITEYENRLAASFRVESGSVYSGMKNLIRMADDIGFQLDDEGIAFNVIYYTHATYLSGRKISPMEDFIF